MRPDAPSGRGLEDRVRATGHLPPPGHPVVVALSGGRDSLCLLDVARRICGGDDLLAVHVHHALRGADADAEATRATGAAARLGVAARVVRLAVPGHVGASSASPVPWARDARRDALRDAADRWGGPGTPVLVAHTASDQAETVLLRAISSPGTRALAGIAPRDDARGVRRPLLAAGATRADTGAWCAEHGVRWSDDPTNPGSPRGRVRRLLAELEGVDARATPALVRTAELAREDDAALGALADAVVDGAGPGGVELERIATAPAAVGRRVLRRLAEDATGRSCPRVGARLHDVLELARRTATTRSADVGDGVRVVVEDGLVRCEPTPPRR
ncbi:tRNA lysidine(34) synthetase [Patulibacter minatonensis]|uniref:tRNA lysidine(34) synthetase n=1 Tax=Patulibacter minatonensis TaxID=298163 RepID=UPI0006842763|nr:tRNA lysidine(34) synthetase [Patulibacter minatonensis]